MVHILGCLAFSLKFWPKIKQLLSNCPAVLTRSEEQINLCLVTTRWVKIKQVIFRMPPFRLLLTFFLWSFECLIFMNPGWYRPLQPDITLGFSIVSYSIKPCAWSSCSGLVAWGSLRCHCVALFANSDLLPVFPFSFFDIRNRNKTKKWYSTYLGIYCWPIHHPQNHFFPNITHWSLKFSACTQHILQRSQPQSQQRLQRPSLCDVGSF